MEMGGSKSDLEKKLENRPKIKFCVDLDIHFAPACRLVCILFVCIIIYCTLLNVISHYDLSVLSTLVMAFQTNIFDGWVR